MAQDDGSSGEETCKGGLREARYGKGSGARGPRPRLVAAVLVAAGWWLAAAGFSPAAAAGSSAQLVHDFYPGVLQGGPPPRHLRRVGDQVFFVAEDRDRPASLWRSDGSAAGTQPVPPPAGEDPPRQPRLLTGLGDTVLWTAIPAGEGGAALYAASADGPAVRLPTHEVVLGPTSPLAGRLYFLDCQGRECAVWSSDGTPAGTGPVVGLPPAPRRSSRLLSTFADRWLVCSRRGAVEAWDVEHRRRQLLLPSGGERASAHPLQGALVLVTHDDGYRVWGSRLSAPRGELLLRTRHLQVAGWTDDRFYFLASPDPLGGRDRLWSTDGSVSGTQRYRGFSAAGYDLLADRLGTLANTTFIPLPGYYSGSFAATRESTRDLVELRHVCSGKYGCLSSSQSDVTVAGDRGFFTIDGQLFQSDGTPEGTEPHPLLRATVDASLRAEGDNLLVGAVSSDGVEGLWRTDGRRSELLSDPDPKRAVRLTGPPEPLDGGWLVPGGRPLPDAHPSPTGQPPHAGEAAPGGPQLWRVSGGSAEQLTALRQLGTGIHPSWTAAAGARRLVYGGTGRAYGVGGGVAEELPADPRGCGLLYNAANPVCPLTEQRAGERVVYVGPDGRVWGSDGTAAGTRRLGIEAGTGTLNAVVALGPLRNEALALTGTGWLWRTDGTPEGNGRIVQLPAPAGGRTMIIGPPVALGDAAIFFRRVPADPAAPAGVVEVWRSDGSAGGTVHLADVPFNSDTGMITSATVAAGRLFFRLHGDLWTSDGTAAGTRRLDPQLPGGTFALVGGETMLYAAGGYLEGYAGPQTMWAIDARTFERRRLFDFAYISDGAIGSRLGRTVGDTLLFNASLDPAVSRRWWVTAGTAESTRPVADPLGTEVLMPVVAGRRYLRACEPEHGCELWSTDAAGEDRRLEVDLWPGPRDGLRRVLGVEDGVVLFAGTEPDVGDELWSLRPAADGAR